jgi:hypothetical protein
MCDQYRMSNNSNSSNSGFFGKLTGALSGAVNAVTGKKNNDPVIAPVAKSNISSPMRNNSSKNKNSTMNFGYKASPNNTATVTQAGGMAPVRYNIPDNQRQPSEEIMKWATTAGVPTPISGMRNVAHGGSRRNRTRRNRNRRNKSNNGGSRRNRNKSRRNRRNKSKKGGSKRIKRNRSRRN